MIGIARWCVRHRFLVVGLWLLALLGLGIGQAAAGAAYNDDFTIPGSDSTKAYDLLTHAFPNQAGERDTIVWQGGPAHRQRMTETLERIAKIEHVTRVVSPYQPEGARQVSNDIAYATVTFDAIGASVPKDSVKQMVELATAARTDGLSVEVGGATVAEVTRTAACWCRSPPR